jgi:hypothetical protein
MVAEVANGCNGTTAAAQMDEIVGSPAKKARVDSSVKLSLHKGHSVCLVLDFGSQYTQLIARRVRENGVYSMLLPGDATLVRISVNQILCPEPEDADG